MININNEKVLYIIHYKNSSRFKTIYITINYVYTVLNNTVENRCMCLNLTTFYDCYTKKMDIFKGIKHLESFNFTSIEVYDYN